MSEDELGAWDRRRAMVARRIEETALRLFASHGVRNVTVGQIAAAAGMSERTFFRYFASREDIMAALPARTLARTCKIIEDRPDGESLFEALAAAFQVTDQVGEEERELTLLWGRAVETTHDSRARAQYGPNMAQAFETAFRTRLRRTGRDETLAGALGAAASGLVSHVYSRWVLDGGGASLGRALEAAFQSLPELMRRP